MRLTRRGRVAIMVLVATLLSLGGFWLGTRTAAHAATAPEVASVQATTSEAAIPVRVGAPVVAFPVGVVRP
ncbi:hypothetical protein [Nonomuraea roseoviolacea]|uniref:Efflux RND transporter periplasmic adaptor subunit n=1 Tax=Nonomuraea roseoviolacea subsp. carminata TaxID=160689 RepID=A0ABT1K9J4_9ACTN|nr:hypothetical protein [Nonomuraea roseoviolacea]MCP2349639.1 hypothetical protein [Nonomuraea roseoviolacea subsp. carminata]